MLFQRLVLLPCVLLSLALICASRCRAADLPDQRTFSGALSIDLDNAVNRKQRDEKALQYHVITLELICENGVWRKDGWGFGASFSRAMHRAELAESTWQGDTLRLVVKVTINREALGEDVEGNYTIELKPAGGDSTVFEGTYAGTYRNAPIKGAAHARIKPLPAKVPGIEEVKSGEHPRLVFRKSELPKLKEAARSPAGLAILAQLKARLNTQTSSRDKAYYGAAHGLLYLLNDDPQEAETARQINEAALRDDFCTNRFLSADALIGVALTYDLCYDAWTPEYRGMVASFIEDRASYMLITSGDSASRGGNSPYLSDFELFPGSDWQAVVRGAAAFAALAILHDPAPPPSATSEPKYKTIAAIPNLDLGRAAPISNFESDAVPANWIFVGPFTPPARSAWGPEAPKEPVDYLESIGGHAGARADAGTRVRAFGMSRDFAAVPSRAVSSVKSGNERSYVDAGAAAMAGAPSYDRDSASVAYYYTVIENDRPRPVRLATHIWNYVPQMSLWISGQPVKNNEVFTMNAGRHTLLVRVTLQPQQTQAWISPRFKEMSEEEAQQEFRGALWNWGEKQKYAAAVGPTFERVKDTEAIAEAAVKRFIAMAVNDCADASNPALPAALSQSVLPFLVAYRNTHGADFATGTAAETILPFCLTQVLSPQLDASHGWLSLPRPVAPRAELFTAGMGNLSPDPRAAVSWAFDRLWGLNGDKSFGISSPHYAVYALANLAQNTPEAAPALSKTFEDAEHNVFVFRNAWKDAGDIVATVNLGAFRIRKSTREIPAPPFFRIAGLGGRWQLRESSEFRDREDRLEDMLTFSKAAFAPKPDGSGVLTALSEGARANAVRKLFAADYGGSSGAPGLFVLVQKGGRTNWRFDPAGNYSVNIGAADRAFTIAAPSGATLKGTLVGGVARVAARGSSNALEISGPSDCVLVLTLQNGAAPAVKTDGEGAAQRILIGGQTVDFGGESINFAK